MMAFTNECGAISIGVVRTVPWTVRRIVPSGDLDGLPLESTARILTAKGAPASASPGAESSSRRGRPGWMSTVPETPDRRVPGSDAARRICSVFGYGSRTKETPFTNNLAGNSDGDGEAVPSAD